MITSPMSGYRNSCDKTLLIVSLLVLGGCASSTAVLPPPAPFTPVSADFAHVWKKGTHPFTGAAVIDIDGDGTFEIFVGGGEGQRDALLRYRHGRLVNIEDGTGLSNTSATYGSTAIDMDADGDTDLIVARENGVYLYLNDGGRFQERPTPSIFPWTRSRLASPSRISTMTGTETSTSASS